MLEKVEFFRKILQVMKSFARKISNFPHLLGRTRKKIDGKKENLKELENNWLREVMCLFMIFSNILSPFFFNVNFSQTHGFLFLISVHLNIPIHSNRNPGKSFNYSKWLPEHTLPLIYFPYILFFYFVNAKNTFLCMPLIFNILFNHMEKSLKSNMLWMKNWLQSSLMWSLLIVEIDFFHLSSWSWEVRENLIF